MNTKTRSFAFCLTACLLACSQSWAQRGPQDTWYEEQSVALPTNCDPYDIIVLPGGNLLLTDVYRDKLLELSPTGSIVKWYGSRGTGNGQFTDPAELAIGPENRIYVADTTNHRIQILERNGTFVKTFGTNGTGDGQFNKPRGLAISSDNEVYVSEAGNHRVQVFDANGTFLRKWGSNGNLEGQLNSPLSLDVDSTGKVFVAEEINNRISVFSQNGDFLFKFNTSRFHDHKRISFLKVYQTGIVATGGETITGSENLLRLREKNGDALLTAKINSTHDGGWSPSTQLKDGTIVFGCRVTNELIFLEQTYRTLRSNPSKDAPLPEVISVTQPAGTNHLEIKYRITDADSVKVKAGLLAFKDGGNDLTKVIVPKTFVGSIAGKLDENTTTGTIHTVTWDAKADWNVTYGDIEVAVVAQDDRDLMNFHFLTLPATDNNSTELKISRSPVDHPDFLNVWYTLLALGDEGITLENGRINLVGTDGVATDPSGTITNFKGRPYILDKMNLREATTAEITRAKEAAISGVTNKFDPAFKVGPGERPVKVNEYGFDTGATSGFWVVPKN